MRVLVVEDDETIREALSLGLQRAGFDVATAADGPMGLKAFFEGHPELVVLDLMLPGLDGISVCRTIRSASVTPVVMLTARSGTEDVVSGLQAGADDYVVKPFEMRELVARLQAVRRRVPQLEPRSQEVLTLTGGIEMDIGAAVVRRRGEPVALTPTEYRLLLDLARHSGMVRTRDDLLHAVWDYRWSGDTRLVDVHIQRLRRKIGSDSIDTVRGIGYRVRRP